MRNVCEVTYYDALCIRAVMGIFCFDIYLGGRTGHFAACVTNISLVTSMITVISLTPTACYCSW